MASIFPWLDRPSRFHKLVIAGFVLTPFVLGNWDLRFRRNLNKEKIEESFALLELLESLFVFRLIPQ